MKFKKTLLAGIAIFGISGQVSAAAIYEFNQSGSDVVGSLSGSLDLTGLMGQSGFSGSTFVIDPNSGVFSSQTNGVDLLFYTASGPSSFGSGSATFGSSKTGASIYADLSSFYLDSGYVSGALLSGSMTFLNTTLLLLGVTPGSYVYTLTNNDTFTLRFNNVSEVPLPAALPLLAAGLSAMGFMGWRRKRKSV